MFNIQILLQNNRFRGAVNYEPEVHESTRAANQGDFGKAAKDMITVIEKVLRSWSILFNTNDFCYFSMGIRSVRKTDCYHL